MNGIQCSVSVMTFGFSVAIQKLFNLEIVDMNVLTSTSPIFQAFVSVYNAILLHNFLTYFLLLFLVQFQNSASHFAAVRFLVRCHVHGKF